MLNLRCAKVDEIINLFDYNNTMDNFTDKKIDFIKIKETLKELIQIFGKTSQCEIEVHYFIRTT